MTKKEIQEPIPFTGTYDFSIKKITPSEKKDTPATIEGYASTFGNKDYADHMMVEGCFDESLKETKGVWPVKLEHQDTIGMNTQAQSDGKGLFVVSDIFSNDGDLPKAKEAVAIVKNCMKYGHKMGLSIGGLVTKASFVYTKDGGYFEIKGFQVLEHSITGTPCNPAAAITSNKSFFSKLKENNALHNNHKFLFDLLKSYDIEIEHWQKLKHN